jgi:hypothetical protein
LQDNRRPNRQSRQSPRLPNRWKRPDSRRLRNLHRRLDQIDQESSADIPQRSELRKLVVEAKTEAQNPNADELKLSSLLRTIAETIKFVGSLGPAYQVIKPLLSYFGIHLP